MKRFLKSDVYAAGLAMFSMFFGAGNVVFPLILGCVAGDKTFPALSGFLFTAVGLPIFGVISIILFDGDYTAFFYRIGKIPGFITIAFLMAIIGPLAAIPRCITLSHSALKIYAPSISLFYFSLIAVVILFVFAKTQSKILDILGYVLTPFLLLSLGIIIIKGLISGPGVESVTPDSFSLLIHGIIEGYNTMDMMGAIFFAGVVLGALKQSNPGSSSKDLAFKGLQAGLIGAFLLGLIYCGLTYVAAFQGAALKNIAPDELLTVIAYMLLGHSVGIVSSIAVALACLTTAIALAIVFAEFLHKEVLPAALNYTQALLITLIATMMVANLGFGGIMSYLAPVLIVIHPALIVLTFVNIAYKTSDFQTVKLPVFATLIVSLILYLH